MTFDRSGTTDKRRLLLELTLEAMRELDRMGTRPGFTPWFRTWDYDPHQTWRSWLIQLSEDTGAPLVLERTWDAVEDRERLSRDLRRRPSLQPTLCVREAPLPREEFEVLRTVGKTIPFPILELRDAYTSLQPAQFGIEGFRKETIRLRSNRVRLDWGVPKPEMRAVASWAGQVRSLCAGCFPDGSISILRAGPTGTCSLCRKPALVETTDCPACKVVYHRDCWEYAGRCAVYGCGGTSEP
jgi:hypothetical protein